ncbi:hypothetical protein [Pseudoroseomonas cervicalis]
MRGGTSRGPFFLAAHLPEDAQQRATPCCSRRWARRIRCSWTASAAAAA